MRNGSGRVPAWLVPAIAGVTAGLAGLVLLDWAVPAELLSRTAAGYLPMSPWTAVALLLAAAALWLGHGRHRGRPWRAGAGACGLLLVALTSAFLFQSATGTDLGIDNLLFPRALLRSGVPYAGRIAPNSAVSLLAIGVASLLLIWGRGRAAVIVGQALALGAGLIALLAIIGYAYGVRGLYFLVGATRMAPSTAMGLLTAATGFFLLRPEHGPAGVATAPDLGGLAVRRLLPLILLLPLVLGRVELAGERIGLWGPRLGSALYAVAQMVMLGAAVWAGGAILGGLDRRRGEAEAARGRLLQRERAARAEAERQVRAELALRRAAEAVSAALTIEDVVPTIAASALEATDSDGVVVKRVLAAEDTVEVIAVSGSNVPRVGSRGPYRGSFTEEALVQLEGRGTVIGDRTAGAVMVSELRALDVGFGRRWVYLAQITVGDVLMSDGNRLEKVGVTPDELIIPTGEDLAAGRDPVMARALELAGIAISAEDAGQIYEREKR